MKQSKLWHFVLTLSLLRQDEAFPQRRLSTALRPAALGTLSQGKLAGRRTFQHLVAMQAWHQASQAGLRCPKPSPCECHCDCPNTQAETAPTAPPPCPMLLPMPTLQPPQTTPPPQPSTTEAPLTMQPESSDTAANGAAPASCSEFEVVRADGTCEPITPEVIKEIELQASQIKMQLDQLEKKVVEARHTPEFFVLRPKMWAMHIEYRRIMDLLLLTISKEEELLKMTDEEKASTPAPQNPGPEFESGLEAHGVHCEGWTQDRSAAVQSSEFCGVICRHQPKCVGFGWDAKTNWCLWYDNSIPPFRTPQCSAQSVTLFLKKREVADTKLGEASWAAIQKVQALEQALDEMIPVAREWEDETNSTYLTWQDTTGDKNQSTQNFLKAKGTYKDTLNDVLVVRAALANATGDAYVAIAAEAAEYPILQAGAPAAAALAPTTTPPPLLPSPTPDLLRWTDFENSHDTQWSEQHPECPQGTPCFCDCKCRGSPPQNFAQPPPKPPMPCPSAPPTVPPR